jgi:signal transduction histidine kinase
MTVTVGEPGSTGVTGAADAAAGSDPYIHGNEETILLDVRDLRAVRETAEPRRVPGPRGGQGTPDDDASDNASAYLGSHRRRSLTPAGSESLLYAHGGTAIPLARVREVCHDLRQPVAAILMLASAAEVRPDVPEAVRRVLQEITDQAEDISSAVRQFLDDAKQGVDGLGDPRPVDLAVLVDECVQRWRSTFQGTIDFVAVEGPLHATVDPVLFRRAVGNLLSNATRAAGPDGRGRVAVTVRQAVGASGHGLGRHAVVEVDDNGPGFGRIPSGHGLGLAVVRRTVEAAGGSVEVGTGHLGGARVSLIMPVLLSAAPTRALPATSVLADIPLAELGQPQMPSRASLTTSPRIPTRPHLTQAAPHSPHSPRPGGVF